MRHFFSSFFTGLGYYRKAHHFIFKQRFWPYLMLPGFLSLSYIIILIFLGTFLAEDFSSYINANFIPAAIKGQATLFIVAILTWILFLILAYMTYKHVVLILFAPILGFVSEKAEEKLYGKSSSAFSVRQLGKDIFRSLHINLRNIFRTILLTIPAWALVFIPLAGPIVSPLLLFMIQAYYSGFGLLDIVLERRRYSAPESFAFMKANRGLASGLGAGFTLLLLIPFIGWFAAPSYGTIAGTIAALENTGNFSAPADEAVVE